MHCIYITATIQMGIVAGLFSILMCCIQQIDMSSRSELLSYRGLATPLSHSVWRRLVSLGVCSRPPTQQGRRSSTKAIDQSKTVTVASQGVKPITPSFHLNSGPAITVKAAVLNAHFVRNKGDTIKDYITDNELEIVALTEAWLSNDDGDQRYVKEMTSVFINLAKGGVEVWRYYTRLASVLLCIYD